MLLILNYYKKITTNAGRIYLLDSSSKVPKKLKSQLGFTLIEILITIAIVAIVISLSSLQNTLSKLYYKHRAQVIETRIRSILDFAKNAAVISNQDITVCAISPLIKISKKTRAKDVCQENWSGSIIIFYGQNKIHYANIIQKTSLNLAANEQVILKKFQHKSHISFNQFGINNAIGGHIIYNNMYYTKNVVINRVGRNKLV